MDPKNMYDAVIVGGGPAGLTAALYLARARYRVVVVEKDHFGGQITITEEVVNYPGVQRTSGAALVETMQKQAESFGAEFLAAEVTDLKLDGDVRTVVTNRGDLHTFGILIATGAHPRQLGFPGEADFQGRGVAYCATCDGEFFTGKEVFVVGGGFAAAEESVFLTKYAKHVTVLVRKDDFSCAAAASEPCKTNPKITVHYNTEVEEVSGDTTLRSIRYRNNKTGQVDEYTAEDGDNIGVFVFAGYEPETKLLEGVVELTDAGYVVVDAQQKTSVDGLYAAGDVCVKNLRQVITATGDGALAATELERYAAAKQKETGIVPEIPASRVQATNPAEAGEPTAEETATSDGTYLDANMKSQLDAVFQRMENPLVLQLHVNDEPVSAELRGWMEELAACTDKLSLEIVQEQASDSTAGAAGAGENNSEALMNAAPCVRVLRADGSDTGLGFHGVPGGHEFTSFVLGLYNASGPGQPLDDATKERIANLSQDTKLTIMVSLSCTNCPDVVQATQRIAADNPQVSAHAYDINHFPNLKDHYNVMSVPCLVIEQGGKETVSFGRKNIQQVLDELGA